MLGGVGVAVSDIWEMKTGRRLKLSIDVRHAAAGLRSSSYLQRPGPDGAFKPVVNKNHEAMRAITQPWPTKDGRWVLPHFGLPNLQARMQKLLGCEPNPQSVAKAVAKWDALDLEAAIDEARVCGGMVRSNEEWLAHPHGQVLAAKPIVEIIKIGESDPEPLPKGGRPLSGIRALDLTRILAGPMAARTLAEHGADVLMVTAERSAADPGARPRYQPRQAQLLPRSCPTGRTPHRLKALIRGADVFSQGYRPGMIAKLGFGPEEVAALRPGIVYASINCYGADGPFSHRGGWEQVAQTMTGLCHEGRTAARPDGPALLPAAACDYTPATSPPTASFWRSPSGRATAAAITSASRFASRACSSIARARWRFPGWASTCPLPSSTRSASRAGRRAARCGISARSSSSRKRSPIGPDRRRSWAAMRPNGWRWALEPPPLNRTSSTEMEKAAWASWTAVSPS